MKKNQSLSTFRLKDKGKSLKIMMESVINMKLDTTMGSWLILMRGGSAMRSLIWLELTHLSFIRKPSEL